MRVLPILLLALISASFVSSVDGQQEVPATGFIVPRTQIVASVHRIGIMPVEIPELVPDREAVAKRLEKTIESQLRAGGFEVVPATAMRSIHDELRGASTGLFDPVTGAPIGDKPSAFMESARSQLVARHMVDAVLHASVVSRQVDVANGNARWDGVVEPAGGKDTVSLLGKLLSGYVYLPGLSLELKLESASGRKLYQRYGALQPRSYLVSSIGRHRIVPVQASSLLQDPLRDERALAIALRPLTNGALVAELPQSAPAPLVEDPDAFRVPRKDLLASYARVVVLPMIEDDTPVTSRITLRSNRIASRYQPLMEARMSAAGFEILNHADVEKILQVARNSPPGFHDPMTGELDRPRWKSARAALLREQAQRMGFQAVVQPILVVRDTFFSGGMASWDGVTETVGGSKSLLKNLLGPDSTSMGTIPALSLVVRISDLDDRVLFENRGGVRLLAKLTDGQLRHIPATELYSDLEVDRRAVDSTLSELGTVSKRSGK